MTPSFALAPSSSTSTDANESLYEELCAPIDEVDQFNRRIRHPAGGVF
jgi:hypothetical protein